MIIPCSDIGPRPFQEFRWGGVVVTNDPDGKREWQDALWHNTISGVTAEWWFHIPTDQWYICKRDILSENMISASPVGVTSSEEAAL